MRKDATEADDRLWTIVRNRRFVDYKFRRQVPVGRYIVDLMCPSAMLIVELDGSQHAENEADTARDAWLAGLGYRVLRIWNNELTENRDGVLETIWHALVASDPSSGATRHLLPQGEKGSGARAADPVNVAAHNGAASPSPLEGEGARRAGEGSVGLDNNGDTRP